MIGNFFPLPLLLDPRSDIRDGYKSESGIKSRIRKTAGSRPLFVKFSSQVS